MSLGKEKYRFLVENLPLGFAHHQVIVDRNGNPVDSVYLDVNPAFEKMTGIAKAAVVGKRATEVFHEYKNSIHDWIGKCGKLALNGGTLNFEHYVQSKQRWYSETVYSDEPGFFTTIFSDITEAKLNEKALQEKNANFQAFFETVEDIILIFSIKGQILFANKAFEQKLGYSLDELTGEDSITLIPLENIKQVGEVYKTSIKNGINSFSFPLKHKNGSVFYLQARTWLGEWNREQCIFCTGRDLTPDLEEKERFEQLFRYNPALMALTTLPERRYHDVNNAYLETLGYTREEVIGKTSAELDLFVHPEDSIKAAEILKTNGRINGFETRIRRKDGTIVEGIFSGQIFSNRGRQFFLTSMLDITARKEAEHNLEAAHERMLTVLNSIDAYVYVVDINTCEILYTNQYGRNLWGNIEGKKCWQVFHKNKSAPCENCTIDKVLDQSGRPAGVYQWEVKNSRTGRWYDCRDTTLTWHDGRLVYLEIATDITEQKLREEKILQISFHDKLTGLYNRSYLEEEMNRLDTERQLPISIIMADLNGLKLINDTLAHAAGDEMLKSAAEVMRQSCRGEDIIARWGGDEFVIFLPQTKQKTAKTICKKILDLSRRVHCNGIPLSMALGSVTKTSPEQNIFELLNVAESNMYKQKLTYGRNAKSFVRDTLLKSLQEKSYEDEEHNNLMRWASRLIGKEVGLSAPELSRLDLLVTLHDIGKINISEDILTKEDILNAQEWEIIKTHPAAGYRIAHATEGLARVAEEILSHHERWDGSGYPRALKGRVIPLLARITAISDAYAVMKSGRPYNKAKSEEEIITEFIRCSGTQFDPELTELFLTNLQKKLSGGRGC